MKLQNLTRRLFSICLEHAKAIVVAMALVSSSSVAFAQERSESTTKWTDSSGAKTIEAEFVKLDGVNLVLRKSDGKEITLPLSKLDAKSRLQARALAKGETPSTSTAGSGASTAPTAGNEKIVIAPVVEFASTATAQQTVDIINREFQKNNALVIWDALPSAKQKQVQELVKLAATKVEQRTMDQIKRFRNEVVKALKTKKQFVLNSTVIPIPPDQKPVLTNSYDAIVGLVDAYIPANLLDSKALQDTELRQLVGNYVGLLLIRGKALEESLPADSPFRSMVNSKLPELKVESSSSTEASVSISVPGQPLAPPPVKFVMVDGRWLPEDMIASWDKAMATATQTLQSLDSKTIHQQVGQGLLLATGVVGSISSAETQADFDAAIQQLMSMGMMFTGGAPAGGAGPGFPGGPQGR